MTLYGIYRSIWTIITLVLVAVGGFWACVHLIRNEIAREDSYRQQYGDRWTEEYTQTFGSLTQAHTRIGIGIVGIVGIVTSSGWLIKVLMQNGRPQTGKPRTHRHHESSGERRARYKRNALLGVWFGVPGILASVLLALFRMGIFVEHSSEVTLAIFVFLGSYCAVMSGCYWWLKAKKWNEAVIIIGFMPLAVLFIPFVRLIFVAAPGLLAAAMVMMPLILVVVVATLPDHSGHGLRRAGWDRRRRD